MKRLEESEWKNLLREIHASQVIPVIGPELISCQQENSLHCCSLYAQIAPKLAEALGLKDPANHTAITTVTRSYLQQGGRRDEIYHEIRTILETYHPPIPQSLLELASITDFNLYISCTFDHYLVKALKEIRNDIKVLRYSPTEPVDIPAKITSPLVYYAFGDVQTYPDFAIWDEDCLEFLCGLMGHAGTLGNLFRALKNKSLLILGAPYEDWLVRFFLRIVKQSRLSEQRGCMTYLADCESNIGEPLVFFFDRLKNATRIIHADPGDFVTELVERWRDEFGIHNEDSSFLNAMPETMELHAVFISYAKEDLATAIRLAKALAAANIPVWLDKERLKVGENYDFRLKNVVKRKCSFFVSLISSATEGTRDRYAHRERQWAAEAHVEGFAYYMPVIIDDQITEPKLEPKEFSGIHIDILNETNESLKKIVKKIEDCYNKYKASNFIERPYSF